MKLKLIIEDEALIEINDAYLWYENQRQILGEDFLEELDKKFAYLLTHPNSCPLLYKQQRQAVLNRFPYVIMYKIEGSNLVIYAVFHTSRNPVKKYR